MISATKMLKNKQCKTKIVPVWYWQTTGDSFSVLETFTWLRRDCCTVVWPTWWVNNRIGREKNGSVCCLRARTLASHNCDGIEAGDNYNLISLYLASSFPICNQAYSCSFFYFFSYSQICAKLALWLISCQAVDLFQSKPIFTNEEITDTMFVVMPGAVEINEAIQPLLHHCPSSTSCCLVAICIKGSFAIGIDCINTADSLTAFENLGTVLGF